MTSDFGSMPQDASGNVIPSVVTPRGYGKPVAYQLTVPGGGVKKLSDAIDPSPVSQVFPTTGSQIVGMIFQHEADTQPLLISDNWLEKDSDGVPVENTDGTYSLATTDDPVGFKMAEASATSPVYYTPMFDPYETYVYNPTTGEITITVIISGFLNTHSESGS